MAYLTIHPDYRDLLAHAGLDTPEQILGLDALVVSGHPDRNVARATISSSHGPVRVVIKREHRVPWKERLASAWAGFGWASKSKREALILDALTHAGIRCPRWIAHGQDKAGRAFLVLEELVGAVDLRIHLARIAGEPECVRLRAARRLGRALARIHEKGFQHPDLYSKHILVAANGEFCLIDWQRLQSLRRPGWPARLSALAALQATVSAELATARERLACLAAYMSECRRAGSEPPASLFARRLIEQSATRLLRSRRFREMQQQPVAESEHSVVWRDGEALCLLPRYHARFPGVTPTCLRLDDMPASNAPLLLQDRLEIPTDETGLLVRRRQRSWVQVVRSIFGKARPTTPEMRQAGLLFRLERFGIPVPRLLAFGQRVRPFGLIESMILTSRSRDFCSARIWLEADTAEPGFDRNHLVKETGRLLRRLHDQDFYLRKEATAPQEGLFGVSRDPDGQESVVLDRVELLVSLRRESRPRKLQDLRRLAVSPSGRLLSRTDRLRFYLAYQGKHRIRNPKHEIRMKSQV